MEPNRSKPVPERALIALFLTIVIVWNPLKTFFFLVTYAFIYALIPVYPEVIESLKLIMESKSEELVAALKNINLSVDTKVAHLTSVKSDIKQKNVPEGAVPSIFESLRLSLASHHSSLLSAGFSTLGHFLKRLFIQNQHHLVSLQGRILYPVLLERLGDHKERVRAQAAQAFTDLWPAAGPDVEHYVLETALVGKNAKAKEMSMLWLSNMTKTHGLLFRTYVPSLVACLEDADSAVRDTAKMTVVELFQNAPARAKSDLKKQLASNNVRKSIANAILTNIGLSADQEPISSTSRPASRAEALHQRPVSRAEALHQRPVSRAETLHQRPVSVMSTRSQHHVEVPKEVIEPEPVKRRPISSKSEQTRMGSIPHGASQDPPEVSAPQLSPPGADDVEPLIIASAREIDDMVRDMLPWFDGRETEENWMARERNVITLRRLTHGNAPQAFSNQYIAAMKNLLDGIFKVVNSLRTTLCTNGCLLIQDLARTCGPRIDPMIEIIMQNLVKLCGGMKKISAQNGNTTLDVVVGNVTFTLRILQHITSASMDKNVQLRLYAAGWIKTIITKQAHHKSSIEHGGGLDLVEKSIKKGLTDANPGVREAVRSTFWAFFGVWTERANDILSDLDAKSRSLLEKDPANPNIDQSKPKESNSRKGAHRSALKEAIAARKKAQLKPADTMPPRPESAQSTFSEAKQYDLPPKSSTVRTVPTGAHISSLSSAPMRPAMKPRRPEIARPATADPYASRKPATTDSRPKASSRLDSSPMASKSKSSTPLAKPPSATRPRQKTDPAHASTTKSKPKKLDISKTRPNASHFSASRSRSNSNESTANHYLERSHDSDAFVGGDVPDSPAPIQLESPPRPVMQRPAPITAPHDSHMVSQDQTAAESSHDSVTEMSDSVHHNINSINASKQTEPVIIYEDPVLPASPEPEHHPDVAVSDEHTATEMTTMADEPRTEEQEPTPIVAPEPPSTPDRCSQSSLSGLDRVPDTDSTNIETHHEFSAPEAQEEPESPSSSVVHHPTTAGNPARRHRTSSPRGSSGPAVTNNNENTTPLSKVAPTFSTSRSVSKINVLEELPAHEPSHRDNKQPRHVEAKKQSDEDVIFANDPSQRRWRINPPLERRRSISPRSKDPVYARELISKGIQRIRAKAMDIHGYRKLQKLIEYHDGIFADETKYHDMLIALLDELESPPNEKKASRSSDVKTQVLLAIRIMFSHNQAYFAAQCPRAMVAFVKAREQYPPNCHFVSGLEEAAEELIASAAGESSGVIEALLGVMEGGEGVRMGLSVVVGTLRRLNGIHVRLSERIVDRLGKFANQNLTSAQAEVRRQVTDLCVQLHTQVASEDRFWRVLGSVREESRNLLTYYIARKNS